MKNFVTIFFYLLRRERLHRVLHIMGFLPEPKLPWAKTADGKPEFLFQKSFNGYLFFFKFFCRLKNSCLSLRERFREKHYAE
jgi:hypothetical protein